MGRVKIPYYVVIKGRGYWRPTAKMRGCGFAMVRCGPDGPSAWAIAATWNDRWQRYRRGETPAPVAQTSGRITPEEAESATVYPRGSLGEAFARYRRTDEWAAKKPATREDWWRGWRRIKPFFGAFPPSEISYESISLWRSGIEKTVSRREAHRALKIWRALWKVAAAMRYCERGADPSLAVRNRAAKGRTETWTEGEVARLVKGAWRMGYHGLAAAVAVMWDTQLSPVDVRTLTMSQVSQAPDGRMVAVTRAKTGEPVGGILSRRTTLLLAAYLQGLGYTLLADAPVFRSRPFVPGRKGGRPRPGVPYTKDQLGDDFRAVRAAVFGEGDRRQMLDIRRSGAVEAIAGGASAEQLGHAMGNTLAASNALFETYVPVNIEIIRGVVEARRRGRAKLRSRNR